MKKIFLLLIILFFAFCSKNVKDNNNVVADTLKTDTTENTVVQDSSTYQSVVDTNAKQSSSVLEQPEYTAKYICPNHCKGSGSDKPGYCPVCGMELIENPNYKGD